MDIIKKISGFLDTSAAEDCAAQYDIYPKSLHKSKNCTAFLAAGEEADVLVVSAGFGFSGEALTAGGENWVVCPLSHENALLLRKYFPFTAPKPVLREQRSVGVGDRLGIATPGHIRAFSQYDAYPVFAQQSIRELNLTNRSYEDVLDCASFAVFREDYQRGFGADGDHLKTAEEVQYALSCGYTMITLDCSEHIRNDVDAMSDEEVAAQYTPNPALEETYLGKTFPIEEHSISFPAAEFRRMSLIYNNAIRFAADIYKTLLADRPDVDFEVSIDETATPTTPAQHYYVAAELLARGVTPTTMAPRFIGEFQKGIDYIGDIAAFEADFAQHAAIARHFGYKISVHSGSDKFSVFGIVGKHTRGNFHLKTAGTSWLEAMAVVAARDAALYREIHSFAQDEAFDKACAYYHVSTDLTRIPPLDTLSDAQLPALFEHNDARQLIHITYGLILNARCEDGTDRFYTRLYALWRRYAAEYALRLEQHIGRHLHELYQGFTQ